MIHRTSTYIRKQVFVLGLVVVGMAGVPGTASAEEHLGDHRSVLLELLQPFKNGFNRLSDYFAEYHFTYDGSEDAVVNGDIIGWREEFCDALPENFSSSDGESDHFEVFSQQMNSVVRDSDNESIIEIAQDDNEFDSFLAEENGFLHEAELSQHAREFAMIQANEIRPVISEGVSIANDESVQALRDGVVQLCEPEHNETTTSKRLLWHVSQFLGGGTVMIVNITHVPVSSPRIKAFSVAIGKKWMTTGYNGLSRLVREWLRN